MKKLTLEVKKDFYPHFLELLKSLERDGQLKLEGEAASTKPKELKPHKKKYLSPEEYKAKIAQAK